MCVEVIITYSIDFIKDEGVYLLALNLFVLFSLLIDQSIKAFAGFKAIANSARQDSLLSYQQGYQTNLGFKLDWGNLG
jgi:hypothetical protein